MTGNAQMTTGSMSNFSTLTTAGGQFESLQGVFNVRRDNAVANTNDLVFN